MREKGNKQEQKDNKLFLILGVYIITFILIVCTFLIGKSIPLKEFDSTVIAAESSVELTEDEKLLAETPLNDYLLFISSEEYTKFQIEAAQMVVKLESEGKTTEEACKEALDMMSDAIYYDKVEFRNNYPNIIEDMESYQKEYVEYLKETQN